MEKDNELKYYNQKFSDSDYLKLYHRNYNDREIACIFNVARTAVRYRRLKFRLLPKQIHYNSIPEVNFQVMRNNRHDSRYRTYPKNREKILKRWKIHYLKNRDVILKYYHEYYLKNRDNILKHYHEYYLKNREKVLKRTKDYKKRKSLKDAIGGTQKSGSKKI